MPILRTPGVTSAAVLAVALVTAGCASRSVNVQPLRADPAVFAAWTCAALHDEIDSVQQRAADVAYAVDERAGNNVIMLSLGVAVFWPALIAMRPDGPDAAELARLKGRHDALVSAAAGKACPPAVDVLAPERAAALPIGLGERLVYEERSPAVRGGRVVGLKLAALRRGVLEFDADVAGNATAQRWATDLNGNLAPRSSELLHWSRLLKPTVALGDVLTGELHAGSGEAPARVRGQVIALGVQNTLERPFDAAVIELFGDAPTPTGSHRVDGVMVVDRKSGTLLRLELRSAHPDFALRRTLMRIEPARPR
jgi:hypothetical protein